MASSAEKPDAEGGTPVEAVTQEAADATPIQIMVWHVHAGAALDATLRNAEKALADAVGEAELRPEITCIGTTRIGDDPKLAVPGADLGALSRKAEQAVLLIHSPLRSDSPLDFDEHLNLNSEGDLHNRDAVSAALVKTTRYIWKHAKRVRDMTVVTTGRSITAAEMQRFDRAKEEAFESSPKNEHLRQLALKKDFGALREHLMSTVLAATDSQKDRRFTFAAVVVAFFVGFVAGVASSRAEPAVAEPEVVEKISIVPEVKYTPYEEVGEWAVATMRYPKSTRDYGCVLAGYTTSASYWLCPVPDSWVNYPDDERRPWYTVEFALFQPGGMQKTKSPPPVQVLARLSRHLLVVLEGALPRKPLAPVRLIDLGAIVEISPIRPNAVGQAAMLFPELAPKSRAE